MLVKNKTWNPFSIEQWIAWCVATGIGVAGITTFFYMNFQTKDSFNEYKEGQIDFQESLERRLDRMEDKIDRLLKR